MKCYLHSGTKKNQNFIDGCTWHSLIIFSTQLWIIEWYFLRWVLMLLGRNFLSQKPQMNFWPSNERTRGCGGSSSSLSSVTGDWGKSSAIFSSSCMVELSEFSQSTCAFVRWSATASMQSLSVEAAFVASTPNSWRLLISSFIFSTHCLNSVIILQCLLFESNSILFLLGIWFLGVFCFELEFGVEMQGVSLRDMI